ncbi:MAG TPA: methyltransferase domain-containing protein [Solirubrobacteraceae bacterium]|nr:methyltransferase domain-containing protein [Solirubrobacteraceae bacterium]
MTFDAAEHRRSSLENWEAAASGWRRRREQIDAFGAPVAQWMVAAVDPQPGERVLELAAGLGETGLLAAELVAPGGEVTISDQAEGMLEGARERAAELGIENVSFQVLGGEWIDLPLASVDIVLCRWGYMLMADPAAALAESRRVLVPGGRLAAAVWDSIERNPWASLPGRELAEHGLAPALGAPAPGPQPDAPDGQGQSSEQPAPPPGPFALGDADRLSEMLGDAGFTDVTIEDIELVRRHPDFDEFWDTTLDLSKQFHDLVMSRPEAEIESIREGLKRRLEPYTDDDGALRVPGHTLVARASA